MAVNAQHPQNVQDSRNRLVPIIKTIILCAQLGIALRGHRYDGKVDIQKPLAKEDGNSKVLLAFCVDSGDKLLEEHFKNHF